MRQQIQRVRSSFGTTIPTALSGNVLYTADDACTIRRVIMQVDINQYATTSANIGLVLAVAPNNIDVIDNPTGVADLSNNTPTEEMGRRDYFFSAAATADGYKTFTWDFDSKGMRSIKEGDSVKLMTLASVANTLWLSGTIILFIGE